MSKKRTRDRRRYFLLDSNQTNRRKPKRLRNQTLNFLGYFSFFRKIILILKPANLMVLVLSIMVIFVLFAILSPFFSVKNINISRDNPNIEVQKIDKSLVDFYGKNLLFVDIKKIETILLETFPEFRSVTVTEQWPESLNIEIDLSEPVFKVFNTTDATFSVISDDGIVLRKQPDAQLPVLELVQYNKPLLAGEKLMDTQTLEQIKQARELFEQELNLTLEKQIYFPLAIELHLINPAGTVFKLDLQLPIGKQLIKLKHAANDIGLYTKKLEHVDLRIPERLYYK